MTETGLCRQEIAWARAGVLVYSYDILLVARSNTQQHTHTHTFYICDSFADCQVKSLFICHDV